MATSSLPRKPTTPASEHDPDVLQRCRVDQPADRLVAGDDRRERDHRDDEQPGEVLGAAVAVGVAAGRGASADDEGDPERDGGQRVGEVVDRVGEQRHRAVSSDDGELDDRGDPEGDEADLDSADAVVLALAGVVDRSAGSWLCGVTTCASFARHRAKRPHRMPGPWPGVSVLRRSSPADADMNSFTFSVDATKQNVAAESLAFMRRTCRGRSTLTTRRVISELQTMTDGRDGVGARYWHRFVSFGTVASQRPVRQTAASSGLALSGASIDRVIPRPNGRRDHAAARATEVGDPGRRLVPCGDRRGGHDRCPCR